MYVVTFYSYKGGVGRTLALVNVAAELARDGKKVLIVDFDLEAPGLPTYPRFECASKRAGLVEYLTSYLADNKAQTIDEYLVECPLGDAKVWLMPAGKQDDPAYSSLLGAIDWEALYEHRHGFLLFEDIKEQWRTFQGGFDYVLIDSRTGHTDVGGICTRQLPDAVVVLFIPDEQNIGGLTSIVEQIRNERLPPREKEILVHFCPSNVPDLDDEADILLGFLKKAATQLRYPEPASIVHHYNSLELLKQEPFVLSRPKSKLAREYHQLKEAIVASNIQDRNGALLALKRVVTGYRGRSDLTLDPRWLAEIRDFHGEDPEIAWNLAQAYLLTGSEDAEFDALTVAIEGEYEPERALLRRASLVKEDRPRAIADLQEIFRSTRAEAASVIPIAAERLRALSDNWLAAVESAPLLSKLSPEQNFRLISTLQTSEPALPLAAKLSAGVLDQPKLTASEREAARNYLALSQIGLGRFTDAMATLGGDREQILNSQDIVSIFNYAIAEWGARGEPAQDFFSRVIALSAYSARGANREQCFALAEFVLGNTDKALVHITNARRDFRVGMPRVFSSWRYLEVDRSIFISDLKEMQEASAAGVPIPPVVRRADFAQASP